VAGLDRRPRDTVRRRTLLRAARRGDRGAVERLTTAYLGLVRAVAWRYRDLGLPLEDLVQEGCLGLLDAFGRYDPSRHSDFEAFARFRVRRAIKNALTDKARLVRLPKQIVERRRVVSRTEATLTAANGRAPGPVEVAAATGLSTAAVLEAQSAAIEPVSLDALVAPSGSPLEALVADAAAADPEGEALSREAAQRLHDAVEQLSPRQRVIVSRHFGLDGSQTGISTVAGDLHLSERRTRTIEQEALLSLAQELERPRKEAKTWNR
jgi:RNA polymerase sigma factor (sigma-70 family)